jgi:hypothetical protein
VSALLLAIVLAEFLYPGIDVFADPMGDKLRVLSAAQDRWAGQGISHYRIVIEAGDCKSDAEVRDEKIVNIFENGCESRVDTVSSLFQKIGQDTKQIRWVNGNCDVLVVHPSFDTSMGYPQKIEYQLERATPDNLGGITYVKAHPLGRLDWGFCTLLYFGELPIYVKSLTPLP